MESMDGGEVSQMNVSNDAVDKARLDAERYQNDLRRQVNELTNELIKQHKECSSLRFKLEASEFKNRKKQEPSAWRSKEQYSPDVGSWYEYYDAYRWTNDTTGLTPLYE